MRFIYLIIIFFTVFQQYIFANSEDSTGELSFTTHLGISKGIGFGLTYNITDRLDITVNGVPIIVIDDDEDNNSGFLAGLSSSIRISDSKTGIYIILPSFIYIYKTGFIISAGVSYRNYLSKNKIYISFDLTAITFLDQSDSEINRLFLMVGLTFGYVF